MFCWLIFILNIFILWEEIKLNYIGVLALVGSSDSYITLNTYEKETKAEQFISGSQVVTDHISSFIQFNKP